jgi:hypothetical protein
VYLETRARQGFNVVQTVALAELDGLNTPNKYGETPLHNNDPSSPNEQYFTHVDFVINKAKELGIYIALLPTWGDKLFKDTWGTGPEVFNSENAYDFGIWLGKRYSDSENIIWIIGGDRNPRTDSDDVHVWNALANGVTDGVGGEDKALISFHPQPQEIGGSSTWFHNETWLDFNMHQTGHCANRGTYKNILHDYSLVPAKPVIDGEPLYEDHPNCFNAKDLGHSVPEDIRRVMYWNVFAGAFGQTYGCHDVWQMYTNDMQGINSPLRPWPVALELPMANQIKHLKNLFLSRPFFSRIPDQSIITATQEDNADYVIATRDTEGTYAMVYFPTGKAITLDLSMMEAKDLNIYWFDPRTGNAYSGGQLKRSKMVQVNPPTSGKGHDWVLVIDSSIRSYGVPGISIY